MLNLIIQSISISTLQIERISNLVYLIITFSLNDNCFH